MSRHVSAETLARRQEGVLTARKAARIDAHMSVCARCSRTNADLAAVSGLLAATQLPPMPDALAQRIEMAIAGESAARANATAGLGARAQAADVSRAGAPAADDSAARTAHERTTIPGRPDPPARSGRARRFRGFRPPSLSSPLVLRGLAATAAVVVIAGVGFVLANGQQPQSKNATSAGAAPASRQPVVGGHASSFHAKPVSVPYRLNGKVVATTAVVSRANFRRKSLAPLVRKDISRTTHIGGPNYGAANQGAGPQATGVGFNVPRMEDCLSRVNAGRTVLLAAVAHFLGKRATVIVLKSPKSAAFLDVAIVGPACSGSNPHVIFETTIPAG